jgi:hypothetical protein
MDYEDDEIIICEDWEKIQMSKQFQASFVVRLNAAIGTFNIEKNRWGVLVNNVPLDYLDEFLEHPDYNWNSVIERYLEI